MATGTQSTAPDVLISIGIFAWNEEEAIVPTLRSLLEQSIFAELRRRHAAAEVLVLANGCTDRTAAVAAEFIATQQASHPCADILRCRAEDILARGKVNAWNQFVHSLSSPQARFLFMMDADILIHRPATLWNMLRTLEQDLEASIAVDLPCKDIRFKTRKGWRDRLSLGASDATLAADGQLCGQLYCVRADVARNIFFPRDLAACEDGFIKAVVCTDFLSHEPWPRRIRRAPDAEHTFEAYTSPRAVLKNQKRQILGQTIVHLLIDHELKSLPAEARRNLAETLKTRDAGDPGWLKRRIAEHLRHARFPWRLYPGLAAQPFRRLRFLSPARRLRCLPAACAAFIAALIAACMAYKSLKSGCTDYWPRAERSGFKGSVPGGCAASSGTLAQ